MNINQDLQEQLFRQREEQICHLDYNQEFRYYNAVASGDMESVKEYLMPENDDAYSGSEYGKLSQNSLWNARYHFVVAVALITRICVEHHMEREIAYTLSDVFIQKIDDCRPLRKLPFCIILWCGTSPSECSCCKKRHTPCMWLGQSTISPFTCTKSFRPATSQMRSQSTAAIFPHCSGRKPESHFTTISLRKKSMPQLR